MEAGGRGKVVSGSTEFYRAAVPCCNRISWNSTSEFINFLFKLLIVFNVVNLVGHVEML